MTRRGVRLWVWWVLVVWAVSFPWTGMTSRPQWNRVHWVPFTDPADRPRDVIANVMLFVPFGLSYGRRGPWWKAVGIAAAVSVVAEASQLFSTSRFPSATDVTAAVGGTAFGSLAMLVLSRIAAPDHRDTSAAD